LRFLSGIAGGADIAIEPLSAWPVPSRWIPRREAAKAQWI